MEDIYRVFEKSLVHSDLNLTASAQFFSCGEMGLLTDNFHDIKLWSWFRRTH